MQTGNVFSKNKLLTSNSFNQKKTKFSKALFNVSKESIQIDNALKSVKLDEHYFSNFLRGKKDPMFKFMKRQYSIIKSDNFEILENFELKNVEYKNNLSKKKIEDIVNSTFNENYKIGIVYRFKNFENPAFQIYVNKINNSRFETIIIDLYHLVIPAPNKQYGDKVADIQRDYNMVKNNDYCLSNIKK